MDIDNVSSHSTAVKKKNGKVHRVEIQLTLEDEKDNHKFEFSGMSDQDMAVSLERHHVADSIDYGLKIDDEALDSINQAREAANQILESNDLEWEVGGKSD